MLQQLIKITKSQFFIHSFDCYYVTGNDEVNFCYHKSEDGLLIFKEIFSEVDGSPIEPREVYLEVILHKGYVLGSRIICFHRRNIYLIPFLFRYDISGNVVPRKDSFNRLKGSGLIDGMIRSFSYYDE
jgi:hypothetical protein